MGEAIVEFVGLDQGFVKEFGVVELEIQGGFDVIFQWAGWVFRKPRQDSVSEVVFPNQSFADDVGVCQGCGRISGKVFEIGSFVGGDLEDWRRWVWELRH